MVAGRFRDLERWREQGQQLQVARWPEMENSLAGGTILGEVAVDAGMTQPSHSGHRVTGLDASRFLCNPRMINLFSAFNPYVLKSVGVRLAALARCSAFRVLL